MLGCKSPARITSTRALCIYVSMAQNMQLRIELDRVVNLTGYIRARLRVTSNYTIYYRPILIMGLAVFFSLGNFKKLLYITLHILVTPPVRITLVIDLFMFLDCESKH